jgi:hypothetical protein
MKDLTIMLVNRPGALADALEALGRAGVNVEGTCCLLAGAEGILHVLVEDAATARAALEAADLNVHAERDVAVLGPPPNRAGAGGAIARRIADRGVNVDLLYLTVDGRPVVGGEDVTAIEEAARG